MKSIVFVDNTCPKSYDLQTLETEALGGTEATVIRIAEKLGETADVVVAQHNRESEFRSKHVHYSPINNVVSNRKWDVIIVLRDPFFALSIKPLVGNTPIWIWLHDFVSVVMLSLMNSINNADIGFIVVSDFLKEQLMDICKIDPFFPTPPKIQRIYNPIADEIKPDHTLVDKNKLLFASSFHKGLKEALSFFKLAQERNPDFKLYISNPSYMRLNRIDEPGVVVLGELKHEDNIQEMRSSLCLFYPNHVYPETFGLVLAESNAVGTPVLTHPFGAANELLQNKDQLINTHDTKAYVDRIMQWHDGQRPKVYLPDLFRLSHVIKDWERLLGRNAD